MGDDLIGKNITRRKGKNETKNIGCFKDFFLEQGAIMQGLFNIMIYTMIGVSIVIGEIIV